MGTAITKLFSIVGKVSRADSRTATLDFQGTDFGLFRRLLGRVPWEAVLKGKRAQEGWTFVKKEILKGTGTGHSYVLKLKLAGKTPSLAEQRALVGTQRKRKKRERIYDLWKKRRQLRRITRI